MATINHFFGKDDHPTLARWFGLPHLNIIFYIRMTDGYTDKTGDRANIAEMLLD
jgi:hypothetical protein